jgi:hypothetical protein
MSNRRKTLWDRYTEDYNHLSDMLESAGIDPRLLRKVVDTRHEYDLCDFMDKVTQALQS